MNAASQHVSPFTLNFDNRFTDELPGDPCGDNVPRQIHHACHSPVDPQPAKQPQLLAFSPEAASLLDLTEKQCRTPTFIEVFSGSATVPGMAPYAMCYGGHQFGSWAGQLGDGRAINLGEIVNSKGEHWALQLKGAGPTPYSRAGDGYAVLRSSLREFICSEAMHHLGIPTTRALSLITTGSPVIRDMFYDGHPRPEPGAVVCRLAPSFIRFGNFEILAARNDLDLLKKLVDYTIRSDFSDQRFGTDRDGYLAWFEEVCRRTVDLAVEWMRVGFVHGVLNTDNMSVLGLTIDYGPYGWLEPYDPLWTPNTTDAHGRRYCYGNQPQIAVWNLTRFGNALFPLIRAEEPLQQLLNESWRRFQRRWRSTLAAKFGLDGDNEEHHTFMLGTMNLLAEHELDFTNFFRNLAGVTTTDSQTASFVDLFEAALYNVPENPDPLDNWLATYRQLAREAEPDDHQRRVAMNRVNPKFVFRNYLAQLAIDQAEQGDPTLTEELLGVLRRPYDDQPDRQRFAARRPEWARNRPGCSMLSCSS